MEPVTFTFIRKRELIALLNMSSWCLVMVGRLFLAVPRGCLQFVIVVFPDHTHLLFLIWVRTVVYTISRQQTSTPTGKELQSADFVMPELEPKWQPLRFFFNLWNEHVTQVNNGGCSTDWNQH